MKDNCFNPGALRESAFSQLDTFCDSFAKIADVKTDLLFGDLAAISEPVLSVILPTFQRQTLFCDALDSILAQQPVDVVWECLVVDNTPLDDRGSTPALEAVRERSDARVLYYHNRVNIGSGYNWNRGAELARGDWIIFLHDDDVMYPDALQRLLTIIRTQRDGAKALGYIHARRDCFSSVDELHTLKHGDVSGCEELTRLKALFLGTSGTGMPSCGTAILKQAYYQTGGVNYDFGLTADAVLGYQIMKNYRVIVSDRSLGAYRWSDNETLKVTSLQNLIYSDYLFAQYRYSQSLFSRIWGRLFWRCEYNENISYKMDTGKRKQILLTPQDLSKFIPYQEETPLRYAAYKILRKMLLCFAR